MIYNVLEEHDDYVILEGIGGYTIKAYKENIVLEKEPEQELTSERPVHDVLQQEEKDLPSKREDKGLKLKEWPYVPTKYAKQEVIDLAFETMLGTIEEKREQLTNLFLKLLDGEEINPLGERHGEDHTLQLPTPESKYEFFNSLFHDKYVLKYINGGFKWTINDVSRALGYDSSEDFLETLRKDAEGFSQEEPLMEIDLKDIATDADLGDAIRAVYSIEGVDDRHGAFSPERAVGMLKRAAEILKKDAGMLSKIGYIKKIFEWLKLSGERGKGKVIPHLDKIEAHLIAKYGGVQEPDVQEPDVQDTEVEPVEPETGETDMDSVYQDKANKILTQMSRNRMIRDEEGLKKVSQDDVNMLLRQEDLENEDFTDYLMSFLSDHGIEVEGTITECGTTAAAGPGVTSGTVNQAVEGVQGVAIVPSRLGLSVDRRKFKESLDNMTIDIVSILYEEERRIAPSGPFRYKELKRGKVVPPELVSKMQKRAKAKRGTTVTGQETTAIHKKPEEKPIGLDPSYKPEERPSSEQTRFSPLTPEEKRIIGLTEFRKKLHHMLEDLDAYLEEDEELLEGDYEEEEEMEENY
jgi:hypothetical protein